MKKLFIVLILLISFPTTLEVLAQEMNTDINIIPKPKSIVINEGTFKLNVLTKIFYKIEANVMTNNISSISVLEKLGFKKTDFLKNFQ